MSILINVFKKILVQRQGNVQVHKQSFLEQSHLPVVSPPTAPEIESRLTKANKSVGARLQHLLQTTRHETHASPSRPRNGPEGAAFVGGVIFRNEDSAVQVVKRDGRIRRLPPHSSSASRFLYFELRRSHSSVGFAHASHLRLSGLDRYLQTNPSYLPSNIVLVVKIDAANPSFC